MVITRQGHIVWSSYVEAIGRIGRKKPQVVAITLNKCAAVLRPYLCPLNAIEEEGGA